MRIGVLALQGAFQPHLDALRQLGVLVEAVRTPTDLSRCDGLILPGGESTTLMRQLDYGQLLEPLRAFKRPLFATCAGLIICSHSRIDARYTGLGLLDIDVERNAYGSQTDSFTTPLPLLHEQQLFPAIFIRAPKISRMGPKVHVLATYNDSPAIISQGPHLGATCHPELSDDLRLHELFVHKLHKPETGDPS